MSDGSANWIVSHARRYLLAGVLTVIPIWVTWIVAELLLNVMAGIGAPLVATGVELFREQYPSIATWVLHPWVQSALGILMVVIALYLIGWLTSRWLGRRAIAIFDRIVGRIPMIQTVYNSMKQLMKVVQQKPNGVKRVVLINFPSEEMKTVGIATRTFYDEKTKTPLVAVYVPTTPNPTSGYLEIVPQDKVISTDWSVDEAMAFVVSGGAVVPDKIHYFESPPTKET